MSILGRAGPTVPIFWDKEEELPEKELLESLPPFSGAAFRSQGSAFPLWDLPNREKAVHLCTLKVVCRWRGNVP